MATTSETSGELTKLLETFRVTPELNEKSNILRKLIRDKSIHAIKDNDDFNQGVDSIFHGLSAQITSVNRLMSVALIERVASVVKSRRKELHERLKACNIDRLPDLDLLDDVDDRYYVALSLPYINQEWVETYAARFAIEEDTAEKVRQQLIQILFDNADSIEDVFKTLSDHIVNIKPETEFPGDSIAKKLKRIISCIRPEIIRHTGPSGNNIGEAISDFIKSAFSGVSKPNDIKLQESVADEILGLLYDIIRTQVYLLTDKNTYKVVGFVMRWFDKSYWPVFIKKSGNGELLKKILSDSLLLMAKMNVRDSGLFQQLVNITGNRDQALNITKAIAENNPGLNHETREWLNSGGKERKTRVMDVFEKSSELSSDSQLALAMLEVHNFESLLPDISDDLVTELKIFDSDLGGKVISIINSSRRLINEVSMLSKRRGLILKYSIGEKLEYSPISHELIRELKSEPRWVKVVRPLVERNSLTGKRDILIKALVEPIE